MQNDKVRVAYQGAPGAFSESAIKQLLGDRAIPVPCATFDALFNSINEGSAERILAPLENTLAGPVLRCYDLLHESPLHITAEVVIRISHCLIGCPGARVAQIRRVESHPVALAQCEKFFAARPEIERVAGDDTADSVRRVLENGDLNCAAIAGSQAAQRYGGQILLSEIEDDPGNFTRFALLSPEPEQAPDADTTALAITIPNEAGSLFRALEPFAKHGVDLASLVSRPLKGTPWHYRFFFDLWAPLGDPRLTAALEMLKPRTVAIRTFGSYRSGKDASKRAEG